MKTERKQRRSWLAWGLLAASLALVALALPLGRDAPVALADRDPTDCAPAGGIGIGIIRGVPSVPVPPEGDGLNPGDTITYTVGAENREDPGAVACNVFNINVHLRTPDGVWTSVCVLRPAPEVLVEGEEALCPTTVTYTVTGDEATWPTIRARVTAKGDKHDSPGDCVDPDKGDPKAPEIPCFGGQGTSVFEKKPPVKPDINKDPDLANLWLCNIPGAPGCDNKDSGVEEVNLNVDLKTPVITRDPKCLKTGVDPLECPRQTIGAFEFEVRYDSKLLIVDWEPGDLAALMQCRKVRQENALHIACVTKGKPEAPRGPGVLASLRVRATADVYSILIANQQNGIATQLINQDCQLADLQGHRIKTDACDDAAITIRYLEGDIHADCVVDVLDQQQIAFRWGARLGSLLYNSRFDLEPSAPKKGDGDIDAKDLQMVYGRHGSTCKDPHPAQDPVDPKAK